MRHVLEGRTFALVTLALAVLAAPATSAPATKSSPAAGPPHAPAPPKFEAARFAKPGANPYLPLVPGTELRYVERDRHGERTGTWTVTRETRTVLGVRCVVVHDVLRDGERVIEDTFDWLAVDRDGNVWYFGEDTREFRSDGSADTEGSWEAGVRGAKPGILMPARPRPGPPYREEFMAGEAEDMGQVVAAGDSVRVAAGAFADCVKLKEWSLLEHGFEYKWFARGVGMVRTSGSGGATTELVDRTQP